MTDFTGRLCEMSEAWAGAQSLWETDYWEEALGDLLIRCLGQGEEARIIAALDALRDREGAAYDLLLQLTEALTAAGGRALDAKNRRHGLLMAVPILIESRFDIGTPALAKADLDELTATLRQSVMAPGVELCLVARLWSPEQLPSGYAEVMGLASTVIDAAASGRSPRLALPADAASPSYLADVRYLLIGARAEPGVPLYRWQQSGAYGQRDECQALWQRQAASVLSTYLPTCALRVLAPAAYYHAQRLTDEALRPFALLACLNLLRSYYGLAPQDIRAVIAPFYDWGLVELRISLLAMDRDEVLQGCIWSVLGGDDESPERIESDVRAVLRSAGIGNVELLDRRMPVVYCEDCGAALFPDRVGELQHIEVPDDLSPVSSELH